MYSSNSNKQGHCAVLLSLLCMCLWATCAVTAQSKKARNSIVKGAIMRPEGRYTFTLTSRVNTGAIHWRVDREETGENKGSTKLVKSVAAAQGPIASFDLSTIPGKETVYYVTASGLGFTDTQRVQVFPANARSSFVFKSAGNPDVLAFITVPATLNAATRIVLVMAGQQRDADAYLDSWIDWAARSNYIAVAPAFDEPHWPGSRSYMLGNVFTGEDGAGGRNPESRWSFTIVEEIHEAVRKGFAITDAQYDLFGHSAGAQFVHRFLLFKPHARVRYALAANAGWYTVPDRNLPFSYGVKHALLPITRHDLVEWTNKRLVILRGTADVNADHNLRVTPEANAQGRNRFERAGYMLEKGRATNPATKWQLIDVPGSDHDQKKMAPVAQELLRRYNETMSNQRRASANQK
jgi:hypothetical protein